MVQIAGKSFTQLSNLNLTDELRVGGQLIASSVADVVVVTSLEDFIESAGSVDTENKVIFLKEGREYLVFGAIDLDDFNIVGTTGASLQGSDNQLDGLTSTAANTVFFNGTGDFLIDKIFVKNTNSTGSLIVKFVGSTAANVVMNRVRLMIESGQTTVSFGTATNLASIQITNCIFDTAQNTPGPFTFEDDTVSPHVDIHNNEFINTGGASVVFFSLDLTTSFVFDRCHIQSNTMTGTGTFIKGTGSGSWMKSGSMGILSDNDFDGEGTALDNFVVDVNNASGATATSDWLIHKNVGLIDSKEMAEAHGATPALFAASDTFARMTSVLVDIDRSYGWSPINAGGTGALSSFTYNPTAANQTATYFVEAHFDAIISASGNATFGIIKGAVNQSNGAAEALTASPKAVYVNAIFEVAQDEVVGIGVSVPTGTPNITLTNVRYTMTRLA